MAQMLHERTLMHACGKFTYVCRVGNVRPAFGSIFEDISKPLPATGPAPSPSVLAAALPTTHAAAQARPAATHEAHVLNLADSDSESDGS